jgi:hypothetical protein
MKKVIVLIAIVAIFFAFKAEHDYLHKRTFNISLDEIRDSVSVKKKPVKDQMVFKNGKLFSDYLNEKFGFSWIRYRINKDSVYTDSTDTEVRMLVVEASATDETNQTVMINFVAQEWDIDGEIKITKNDKLKKYFEMVGREKGGKPKKPKSQNKKVIEVLNENNAIKTETIIAPPGNK